MLVVHPRGSSELDQSRIRRKIEDRYIFIRQVSPGVTEIQSQGQADLSAVSPILVAGEAFAGDRVGGATVAIIAISSYNEVGVFRATDIEVVQAVRIRTP